MSNSRRQPGPGPSRSDDAEMFDLAPVALWVEDFSGVKAQFAEWRRAGVTNLREYLRDDPERARQCAERIGLVKVNRRTLQLFEADDFDHLARNLHRVFRDDMLKTHGEELKQLWEGQRAFLSNTFNYTLSGQRLGGAAGGRQDVRGEARPLCAAGAGAPPRPQGSGLSPHYS